MACPFGKSGELVTAWGGRTRIDGDGLGSAAVAANFGTLAGLVRPEELEAGRIEHALFMTVPCVGEVAGSDTVYFPPRGHMLDANAIATLTAPVRPWSATAESCVSS